MGVYLPNMEMPKSCDDCPLGDSLSCQLLPGVPALWREYTNAVRENRRHSDCPLVPVPPHGRLGDLDELERRIKEEGANQAEQYGDRRHPVVMAYGDCFGKVKSAPTIIPAEEEES